MVESHSKVSVNPADQDRDEPLGATSAIVSVGKDHGVDPNNISNAALDVIRDLQQAGFTAYLVGGAVRDLLLEGVPKDYDIATDATPEQVRSVFRRCRLIGRRFRLAHVFMHGQLIEVATFRGDAGADDQQIGKQGRILRDNTYGNEQEDALRRDFTANALFYDPLSDSIIDYAGGLDDIEHRRLRLIGDVSTRYREDPVRMLRAVRFAVSKRLDLHPKTAAEIPVLAHLLQNIPAARLFDEFTKLMLTGHAFNTTCMLVKTGLWEQLFPDVPLAVEKEHKLQASPVLSQALKNSDARVAKGLPVTSGFLLAAMLWQPLQKRLLQLSGNSDNELLNMQQASDEILFLKARPVGMPKRVTAMCREIWLLQHRFNRTRGKRPRRLMEEQRFRAAYDFLLLRAAEEPALKPLADWWTFVQTLGEKKLNTALREGFNP